MGFFEYEKGEILFALPKNLSILLILLNLICKNRTNVLY